MGEYVYSVINNRLGILRVPLSRLFFFTQGSESIFQRFSVWECEGCGGEVGVEVLLSRSADSWPAVDSNLVLFAIVISRGVKPLIRSPSHFKRFATLLSIQKWAFWHGISRIEYLLLVRRPLESSQPVPARTAGVVTPMARFLDEVALLLFHSGPIVPLQLFSSSLLFALAAGKFPLEALVQPVNRALSMPLLPLGQCQHPTSGHTWEISTLPNPRIRQDRNLGQFQLGTNEKPSHSWNTLKASCTQKNLVLKKTAILLFAASPKRSLIEKEKPN